MSYIKIKPYDDKDMIWDEENRRYRLTSAYIKQEAFDPTLLGASDEAQTRELKRISRNLYNFLYSESCKFNNAGGFKKDQLEHLFAIYEVYRKGIKEALLEFAMLDNSTNGGTGAEYFADNNITTQNMKQLFESKRIINKGYITYCGTIDPADFVKEVSTNGN